MNGLLEFSFEEIPQEHFSSMILNFIGGEKNVNGATFHGNDISLSSLTKPAFWTSLASLGEDIACDINLPILTICGRSIARATLLFVRYNDTNDISVLLSTTDCRRARVMASEEFYQWARTISEKYGVDNFSGGLDSASDKDTQMYFTAGVGVSTTL